MMPSTFIAKSVRSAVLLASTAISTSALANDLPTGGEVAAGSVSIGTPSGGSMAITQHSDRAVVNWTSFSVGEGNVVNIAQPTATSALLNRVTGDATSVIAGQINANGQVVLVNPNGIAITKSGTINAAAFTASTLDIGDAEFMAGGDAITVTAPAQVMRLRAGLSDLLSPDLADGTLLVAGVAKMDGSDQAALDLTGDGFLRLGLPTGSIDVAGTINADTVVLTAGTARDAARGVVNLSGVINATGVESRGGVVRLTGDQITLTGATIDASGPLGGGSIEIGGGYQGTGDLAHATDLNVDAASVIRADALSRGDGGEVVLWSDHKTDFAGTITARGGINGGNGGNAEVSGKALLAYNGSTNLLAPKGRTGDLLLDPYNVTISSDPDATSSGFTATGDDSVINIHTLTSALNSANVTVSTGTGGSQAGNITVANDIIWSTGSTLELSAAGSIMVNAAILNGIAGARLILRADNAGSGTGTVTFGSGGVGLDGAGGTVDIYYNPSSYAAPTDFSSNILNGTLTTWMLVNDATDLQNMGTNLAGIYALSKNIDASETVNLDSGKGFTPVGTASEFTGTFDGQGHVISDLTINRPATDGVGLFGFTAGAKILNIGLEGGSISGHSHVGGLVGLQFQGTVTNSYATGLISGYFNVGGLVGRLDKGTVRNSYATGSVSSDHENVGGLVGDHFGGTISNAYATGSVSGVRFVGGLVGFQNSSTIRNSYATGSVSSSDGYVGGLAGTQHLGNVENAYWDSYTTGMAAAFGGGSGANQNVVEITSDPSQSGAANYAFKQSAYTNFNFTNDWYMIDGETRPFGRWEHATEITNAHQVQLMAMDLAASYTLGADVDMSVIGEVDPNDAASYAGMWRAGFDPVGDDSNNFTGTFDGQGHVISGLTINRPSENYAGLFGYTDGASLSNIGLEGGSITGDISVGELVGQAHGTTISNAYATGAVSGTVSQVGGLVGRADTGTTISNAYATGAVSGTAIRVGGLVGLATSSITINNSYATGAVSGSGNVGGLVGYLNNSQLENSYWDSYSTGQSAAVGTNSGSTVTYVSAVTSDPAHSGAANYAFTGSAWSNFQTIGGESDIDLVGGQDLTWRMYEGHTAPLLKAFMTGLTVTVSGTSTVTYDGQEHSLTPTLDLPSTADQGLVMGSLQVIRGTNAGTYTGSIEGLYSSQQGYDLVADGTAKLTINPAEVTVTYTADAVSRAYGDGNGTLSGEVSANGFIGSDKLADIAQGTLSWTSDADTTTGVGDYLITGSGYSSNSGNYTFKTEQAAGNSSALTITPRALTITYTANGATSTYGDAPSGLAGTYTYDGLVNDDGLTGTASWTTNADGTTGIGDHAITGSGLDAGDNYTLSVMQAAGNSSALTIKPRSLTVHADDLSRVYGEANPELTYKVTSGSLVNGDILSGDLSTTVTVTSDAGDYTIDASGLSASSNYTLTLEGGTLTITKRPLTITYTANAVSSIFGDALPELTGSVSSEGLVNGDGLTGTANWTTTADGTSEAGDYAITGAGLGASDNYTVEAVQAVGNATALTIVAPDTPGAPDTPSKPDIPPAPVMSGPAPDITAGTLYGSTSKNGQGFLGSSDDASSGQGLNVFDSIETFCEDGSC